MIILVGMLLFCWSMIGGRPLTMQEAELAQSTREMVQQGHWLVPHSGDRPWVENPPMAQWITAILSLPLGGSHHLYALRAVSAGLGVLGLVLVAWIATRLFNREVGIMSAFILATTFQYVNKAWMINDDLIMTVLIFGIMALFVAIEFPAKDSKASRSKALPWNDRPWQMILLFILLAFTNLVNGPGIGMMLAMGPMLISLLLRWKKSEEINHEPADWLTQIHWSGLFKYFWIWGIVLLLVISVMWPLLSEVHTSEAGFIWWMSLTGQYIADPQAITRPLLYYFIEAPILGMPWTPLATIGVGAMFFAAVTEMKKAHPSNERYQLSCRFILIWGVSPLFILTFMSEKNSDYLTSIYGAWAIGVAVGLYMVSPYVRLFLERRIKWVIIMPAVGVIFMTLLWLLLDTISFPRDHSFVLISIAFVILVIASIAWIYFRPRIVFICLVISLLPVYLFMHSMLLPYSDGTLEDQRFLKKVNEYPLDAPLLLNADIQSRDYFRLQYDLPKDSILIHNLTYLRDHQLNVPRVYVITRRKDAAALDLLGTVREEFGSNHSRAEQEREDRFVLFRLDFDPDIQRMTRQQISPLQALSPEAGPYLGTSLDQLLERIRVEEQEARDEALTVNAP